MANAWQSYATVNDDVRHTYERVFYGRETTADLNPNDVPGMIDPARTHGVGEGEKQQGTVYGTAPDAAQPGQAAGGVWGETLPPEQPAPANLPQLGQGQTIDQEPGVTAGPAIDSPKVEPPPIEPPAAQPPAQGNDMTPG